MCVNDRFGFRLLHEVLKDSETKRGDSLEKKKNDEGEQQKEARIREGRGVKKGRSSWHVEERFGLGNVLRNMPRKLKEGDSPPPYDLVEKTQVIFFGHRTTNGVW